jgi:hypothetical protein
VADASVSRGTRRHGRPAPRAAVVIRPLRDLWLRAETPTPGGVALIAAAGANVALWLAARPTGQPTQRFVGELCGAEAILLFSVTLVLATLLPAIERAFSGLDRVAVWHRRTAMAGVLLLIPHWVLATSTPDRYATGVGPGLGDFALLGLLVLSVWALAPGLRAARWPGPIRWLARTTYERWLPPQLTDPATKRQRLGVRGVSDKTRVRRCSRTPAPRVSQLLERSSRGDSRNPTPPTFWWRRAVPKLSRCIEGATRFPRFAL